MKTFKEKFHRFIKDDNGMEFIAVAVIVAGGVLLAGIAVAIYQQVKGSMEKASGEFSLPQ